MVKTKLGQFQALRASRNTAPARASNLKFLVHYYFGKSNPGRLVSLTPHI